MSYRQPKIVDDKSGQVLGQAIVQGAQNLAQGAMQMAQKNQLAIKEEKKEKEDLNVGLVNLAAQYNNDLQAAAKLTKEQLSGIKNDFGISMEEIINQGYLAQQDFLKDKSNANRKRVEENATRRTGINKWMVGVGALVTNAQTLVNEAASDIATNVWFPPINGDDGTAGLEMTNAFLNKEGYSYGHIAKEKTNASGEVAKGQKGIMTDMLAIYKDGKVIGTYSETDLSTILGTWKKRGETGIQTVQNGAKKEFVTESVNGAIINNGVKATDANKLDAQNKPTIIPAVRKIINGNIVMRQDLDPTAIGNIVEQQVQIMAGIVGKAPTSEKRLYYKDFGFKKEQIEARNLAISLGKASGYKPAGVDDFDKEFLKRVENTVLGGLNVTKEVIPGENGAPDTVRYYNDKVLGRNNPTTTTSAGERAMFRDYKTTVNNFNSAISGYTPPASTPNLKQTAAQKIIGGAEISKGKVMFIRNQNRTLENVITNDNLLTLSWGRPYYAPANKTTEPYKYQARELMLAGTPNAMVQVGGVSVSARSLAPDMNSITFDLKNKNQTSNLLQLTTGQDATAAAKLIKKYNLN